ncbi:MAG: DEAD/DEAH box helicase, partial [Chromatiaceae bacterium]
MDAFSRPLRLWFEQNFAAPTAAQARGWPVIASGAHCLLTAPTGSGKTLAAFLWAIDQLLTHPGRGTRVLYISPLKALAYDIERNLRAPLAGAAVAAAGLGLSPTLPRVGIRTGDTPAREREQQRRDPPEILVTTPESLYLLLGSRAHATLAEVGTVIVDEVHALAPTKRGAHLALSLERLSRLCEERGSDPQRIGLSATVTPLAEAAGWLGGNRPVTIVDAAAPPRLTLTVTVPVAEMAAPPAPPWPEATAGGPILGELMAREQPEQSAQRAQERGLWAALHPALLEAILAHRSSIIFVNSRGLCERLCQRLNDLHAARGADPQAAPLVRAHHGSVSHAQRAAIEEALKRGELRAIVATSSLEMGIDMGAVDQVLLVESPGTVARGLQRVGRAGHAVGAISQGRIFPKFRGDLLECAVVGARMLRGELEPLRMPRLALDVLAQQIAATCVGGAIGVADLHRLVTRAGPYRDLSRPALEAVLDMLSGRYPSSDFADLRPLLNWDRASDQLSARKGAAMVTRLNGGTIPDRGSYAVQLPGGADGNGGRIGELDEEMVFETRAGECILLGASTWRVEEITRDRVIVTPAPGEPGKLPFWRGDGPGRPVELGRAIGAFCRELAALVPPAPADLPGREQGPEEAHWPPPAALDWIQAQTPLDRLAARNLAAYLGEQRAATGQVPSDRVIVCERFRDELGDWRVCLLTPFGARIHGPWAMALQWQLARRAGFAVQVMWTDDGIVLRLADGEELPDLAELLPAPDALEDMVTEQLAETALFASLFRENAGRALLLTRRSPQGRQPLWAQRLKAQNLLAAVRRYPAFPIVLETYRQALGEVFDLPGLKALLTAIRARQLRVHEVETRGASPFARALVFAYVAAFIYEQDAPLAERRAAALTLDRGLLAELLGQAELRALIDPLVLADLERELQHLTPTRRARDADTLADLLRRLGDLNPAEIAARCSAAAPVAVAAVDPAADPEADLETDDPAAIDPAPWLQALAAQRRAVCIRIAGETRWISAEDAGRYRDALGVVPPPGLPAAFVAATAAPLEELLRRYARTHGPFPTQQAAARLGLRPAQVEPVLRLLETRGLLVRGELRPDGSAPEWCDAEVLRQLRRRTLARARDAVAPVDAATLGRFLPAWHGIGAERAGPERLLEAVWQLAGLRITWSQLERVLLPARVPGYRPADLDLLAATGQIVWVGQGAAGPRDGWICLYRRDQVLLAPDPAATAPITAAGAAAAGPTAAETGADADADAVSALRDLLRTHLHRRGACFLMELQQAAARAGHGLDRPAGRSAFDSALWDLVWAGQITNDTFAPLRA